MLVGGGSRFTFLCEGVEEHEHALQLRKLRRRMLREELAGSRTRGSEERRFMNVVK